MACFHSFCCEGSRAAGRGKRHRRELRFSSRMDTWRWRPEAGPRDDGTPAAPKGVRLPGRSRVQPPRLPAALLALMLVSVSVTGVASRPKVIFGPAWSATLTRYGVMWDPAQPGPPG